MQKEKQKIILSKKAVAVVILSFAILTLLFIEASYKFGVINFSPSKYLENQFGTRAYDNQSTLVRFLDVGQGDCTIIKVKDKCAVIDFGVEDDFKVVYKALKELGVEKIDVAFITHLHKDHIGGFLNLPNLISVDNIVVNESAAEDFDKEQTERFFDLIEKYNINKITPTVGSSINLGGAAIEILYADNSAEKENNRSVVLKLNIEDAEILFTGDGEKSVEEELINLYPNLSADILKLGHHGSATSTNEEFIKQINPIVAVASSGYNNFYNHPSEMTISRLEEENIKYYRTDLDGDITITFAENSIKVETERRQDK
jgi:competence protein ComEC